MGDLFVFSQSEILKVHYHGYVFDASTRIKQISVNCKHYWVYDYTSFVQIIYVEYQ